MAIFTHVVLGANDLDKSRKFYDATLGALGVKNMGPMGERGFLYGKDSPEFLVTKPANGQPACHANGGTIGFKCESAEQVKTFHDVAVAHGGTSIEEPPGLRESAMGAMHLSYVRDPDGNKLCAVWRVPKA